MWVKLLISIGVCVSYLVTTSKCNEVIYQPNNDFYDRRNWLNNAPQTECHGLIMEQFYGTTTFKTLEVEQLVFGKWSEVLFNEDTEIIFDNETKSEMNCVVIDESQVYLHRWVSLDIWLKRGRENNDAVPHLERLPCEYDDVVFPYGYLSGTVLITQDLTVKSLKFGDEYWNQQEWTERNQDYSFREVLIFLGSQLKISNNPCNSESGCLCGNEVYYKQACFYNKPKKAVDCTNPILPIGFCYEICGAVLVFKPKQDFQIKSVEDKLKVYSSDTHVSKVKNKTGEIVIQIIFTEKQFTGNSIEQAKHLYQLLQHDQIIQVKKSEFLISHPMQKGSAVLNTISIILGSLLSACIIFALILFLFGDNKRTKQFRERFGLGSKPLIYKSVFFSRSSSVGEGTGLIVEGQSMEGSIPDIPKTFENPTYSDIQKKSSSTSSSVASSAEDVTKETNKAVDFPEPQIFEERERRHLIETVAEEGELVDLSDMS